MSSPSQKKYKFYKRQEFTCEILKAINLLRTNTNEYISSHPSLKDVTLSALKSLSPVPPIAYNANLFQSTEELLQYLILTDSGSHNPTISDSNYKIQNRLTRFGFYSGCYSEIVLINKNTIDAILTELVSTEAHPNDITNPYMNYIAISIDTLPSECLCVVIDMVYEYKGAGDIIQKTLHSSYIPKEVDTKSYVVYPSKPEPVREFMYTTVPNEEKITTTVMNTEEKNYDETLENRDTGKGLIYPYRRNFNINDDNLVKEDFQSGYEVLVLTKDMRNKKRRNYYKKY